MSELLKKLTGPSFEYVTCPLQFFYVVLIKEFPVMFVNRKRFMVIVDNSRDIPIGNLQCIRNISLVTRYYGTTERAETLTFIFMVIFDRQITFILL
jgi:hypothetical protein